MGYSHDELDGAIVLDIETVASPDAAQFLDPVKAPSNYKDEAKIAAYCAEQFAERVSKAGLEADLCEVVAVGFMHAERSEPAIVWTRADGEEPGLLRLLWDAIGNRRIIGFNSLGFDLPVLIRRSQLLGVPYPAVNLDRYRTPHVDMLQRLSFNGALTYRSLAFYGRRFGLSHADTTKGSDIAALVAEGNWQAVAAHCRADVELTAALAARLGYIKALEAA